MQADLSFPLLFAFLSFFLSFPFSVWHKPGCIFTPVHRINRQPASVFALATTSVSFPWEDRLLGLVILRGTLPFSYLYFVIVIIVVCFFLFSPSLSSWFCFLLLSSRCESPCRVQSRVSGQGW